MRRIIIFILIFILYLSYNIDLVYPRIVRDATMDLDIIATKDEDQIQDLIGILQESVRQALPGYSLPSEEELGYDEGYDPYEDFEAIVAIDKKDNKVMGGFLYKRDFQIETEFELETGIVFLDLFFGVDREYVGRGVRRKLFQKLVDIMREEGHKGFQFYSKDDAESIRFWRSIGCSVVATESFLTTMEYIIKRP